METLVQKFSNRSYKFSWGKLGETREIEVLLPNLSKSKYSVWGDWGPMHSYELAGGNKMRVSFEGHSYELEQGRIEFLSPILAEDRKETPLYSYCKDQQSGHVFYMYFDQSFNLQRVEAWDLNKKNRSYEVQTERALMMEAV